MVWADFLDYLQHFRTDKVVEQLAAWNVGELSSNPYVLAGFAVAIAITYFLGWKTFSAFIVGIGGFSLAVSHGVKQGIGVDGIEGGGLSIMLGVGVLVIFLFIYLLFIKSE